MAKKTQKKKYKYKETFVDGICEQDDPKKPGQKRYKAMYYIYKAQKNGKVKQVSSKTGWFSTKELALARAKQLSVTPDEAREELKKPVYIEDVMEAYMEDKKKEVDRSSRTHISRFNVIRKTWNELLGHPNLRKVTQSDFTLYKNYLLNSYHGSDNRTHELVSGEGGKITWNYFSGLRRTTRTLMEYANENSIVTEIPLANYARDGMAQKKPNAPKSSKLKNSQEANYKDKYKYLSEWQLQLVIQNMSKKMGDRYLIKNSKGKTIINPDYEYMVLFLFCARTGLRLEEWKVLELGDLADFDFDDALANVKHESGIPDPNGTGMPADTDDIGFIPLYISENKTPQVYITRAYNSRQYGIEVTDIKSEKAERKVPLYLDRQFLFVFYNYVYHLSLTDFFREGNQMLFPNTNGRILKDTIVNNRLKRECQEVLGGKYISCYGFRHTFAQWLYEDLDFSLDGAMRMMGHKDSSLLKNVYTSQTVDADYRKTEKEALRKSAKKTNTDKLKNYMDILDMIKSGKETHELILKLEKTIAEAKSELERIEAEELEEKTRGI